MGDFPQPAEHIRHGLLRITRQILLLLSDEQFQSAEARAIGARLALLGYKRVDALVAAQLILCRTLTQGLEPSQVESIHTRLGQVLIELTTGFLEQHHQDKLLEQEQTLQAYESEWKRFIADRQEMEQKSQAILRALPDTLEIITLDGVVLYYHGGSERRFQNEEDLPFKNIRSYLPDQVAEELLAIYRTVIETGHPRTHEYSVTFQTGGKRDFQDNITPYMGNSVLVISRDVTRQKQIEEELRASETRYRTVVEDQVELIARWLPDRSLIFINQAVCNFMGREYERLIHTDFNEILKPGNETEAQKLYFTIGSLTPENPIAQGQSQIRVFDNMPRWLEWKTRAFFDKNGRVTEYQTTASDVTEIKRVQDDLRESEARYRSVVEGQTELIIRYLLDGTITFVNDALCGIFSKTQHELLGSSVYAFVYEIDKPIWAEFLESLKNIHPENPIRTGQARVAVANNEMRWVEWTTRVIFGTDGTISEFQSVGRDITALMKAQEVLEQQNELLRQLGEQLINVQETERQRIALDLHDSVLNELGAMLIAPQEMLTPKTVRDNYERLIDQLRQTINGLRSPMLNYGLHAALDDLMDNPQAEDILKMEIPPSQARFDTNVELHLFRIIQQACDNALQHAQAHSIRIYGQIAENLVDITVKDDGIGFLLGQETDMAHILVKKHFGLVSMLERGKLIGANVQLSSNPGAGTIVRVLWEPTYSWT